MALQPGSRLGPYEIQAPLGAGGMGTVYRAMDTSLDRDVAIKVLPDAFASDPERLARFEREAKVLASLNHPNIGGIHGLETSGDTRALILELVEGLTLADRIAQGPIPVDEALPIAKQIADALEAAHEQGIIHRDLKPANIKLRPDGTVKVLDFGLAKALDDVRSAGASASATAEAHSPTMSMTAAATKMGVLMGTAAYMSPEQAKGRPVDKRTDIWAYGVVLFEMLTGQRAFQGEDVSSTLAKVIEREPEWTLLPVAVPVGIRTLLRRCVTKDRARRIPDIRIASIEIDDAFSGSDDPAGETTRAPDRLVFWQRPIGVLCLVLAGAVVTGVTLWNVKPDGAAVSEAPVRFTVTLPASDNVYLGPGGGLALSPDGRTLVYTATRGGNRQLYRRETGSVQVQPIPGTEGAAWPFFSPDGAWVGLTKFGGSEGWTLSKVSLAGGTPVLLWEGDDAHHGATWSGDGTILMANTEGIVRVPDSGGEEEVLIASEGTAGIVGSFGRPQLLPSGEHMLFTRATSLTWTDPEVVVESLATGERRVVIQSGTDARYLPTGHLVYVANTALFAVPFDLGTLEVVGEPVALAQGVARMPAIIGGLAYAAVSLTGALAYVEDVSRPARGVLSTLVWVDRDGREEPLAAPQRGYTHPRISPDGSRVVLGVEAQEQDLWTWDVGREVLTRLTFAVGGDYSPVWTPDGRRVIFGSSRDGGFGSYWKAADGTGEVERPEAPTAMSPDGEHLVLTEYSSGFGDLAVLTLADGRSVSPLLTTPFSESEGAVSPDGRWIAYQSNASGRVEVYVQPFPNLEDGRWQVSTDGGGSPAWGPFGDELFYMTPDALVAVPVRTSPSFEPGRPGRLFGNQSYVAMRTDGPGRTYDVAPDGQRFLMIKDTDPGDEEQAQAEIQVVLNLGPGAARAVADELTWHWRRVRCSAHTLKILSKAFPNDTERQARLQRAANDIALADAPEGE